MAKVIVMPMTYTKLEKGNEQIVLIWNNNSKRIVMGEGFESKPINPTILELALQGWKKIEEKEVVL